MNLRTSFSHLLLLFVFNLVSANFIKKLNNLKILNNFDIIVCSNSALPMEALITKTWSLSVLNFRSCHSCFKGKNFKLPNRSIFVWLLEQDVIFIEALHSIKNCLAEQSLFYKENLSGNHPVYHFVFTSMSNSSSRLFVHKFFEEKVSPYLTHPQEFFLCHFHYSSILDISRCVEMYNLKNKKVVVQEIKIETAITEISIRRLNFAQITIPGVATDLPGYSKKFKPRLKPDDPLEFLDGSNVNVYRYLRDSLNFKEKAVSSNVMFTRSSVDGFLENTGIVESMFSGDSDFSIGQYEFVPYRMGGRYGVRYLHSIISTR